VKRGIPVVVADRDLDPQTVLEFKNTPASALAFTTMDVSDFREVMAVFTAHPGITHVIHLAYVMGPLVDANTSLSTRVNVLGMTNMFEAAAMRKLARLVFTSSETVYGPSQKPYGDRAVTEDDFCDPNAHFYTYAVMKLLNEHMARKYIERHNISIAAVRPAVVFGHGRKRSAVMWAEQFATYPALGRPVTLPFSPDTRDTWLYKDDCAEQLVRLCLKPKLAHFAYNNGGTCVSARELAALVKQIIPDARIDFAPTGQPKPLIDNQDGKRLAKEIDFIPRPLIEGIRAHIQEAQNKDHA
jgi:nucleoside-diphosphate-sugar epimerase